MGSGLLPRGSSAVSPSICMNLRLSAVHDWALTLAFTFLHATSNSSWLAADTPITMIESTSLWLVERSSSRSCPSCSCWSARSSGRSSGSRPCLRFLRRWSMTCILISAFLRRTSVMLSPRSMGARWMLTSTRARRPVRSLTSWSLSSGGRPDTHMVRCRNLDSNDSTSSWMGLRASMLHGHTRSFVSGLPGACSKRRSLNRNSSPGRSTSAMRRRRCSRSSRVALHASMERIWLTRLLHRAFRLATAACSSLSWTVTVRVFTVLVSRLTDSSLPWASRL